MHRSASEFFLSLLLLSLLFLVFSKEKTVDSLSRSKNSELTNLNQFFCSYSFLVSSSSTIITKTNHNNWHSPHLFSKILQYLSIRHLNSDIQVSRFFFNFTATSSTINMKMLIPSQVQRKNPQNMFSSASCSLCNISRRFSTSKYLVWAFYNYSQRNSFRLLDFTQHISISDACSILNVLCSFSKSSNSLVWTSKHSQRLATTRHLSQIKYSLAYNLPDDLRFSVFLQTRELHNLASDLEKNNLWALQGSQFMTRDDSSTSYLDIHENQGSSFAEIKEPSFAGHKESSFPGTKGSSCTEHQGLSFAENQESSFAENQESSFAGNKDFKPRTFEPSSYSAVISSSAGTAISSHVGADDHDFSHAGASICCDAGSALYSYSTVISSSAGTAITSHIGADDHDFSHAGASICCDAGNIDITEQLQDFTPRFYTTSSLVTLKKGCYLHIDFILIDFILIDFILIDFIPMLILMATTVARCSRWTGTEGGRTCKADGVVVRVDRHFCLTCMQFRGYYIGSRRIFDRHPHCAPAGSPLLIDYDKRVAYS